MRVVLLAAAVLLLVAAPAAAQNRYFADGDNGFWLGAAYLKADGFDGLNLDAVLTLASRFDLGLAVNKLSSDDGSTDVTEISPHLGYAVLRPTALAPFGLDLVGGVSFADFANPYYTTYGIEVDGSGYVVGGEFYLKLGEPERAVVLPALGLAYTSVTTKVKDIGGTNETTVDNLALSLSVTVKAGRVLTLGAGAQIFDDTTTLFAGAGGAFAMAGR
jgi:hypothetical protein